MTSGRPRPPTGRARHLSELRSASRHLPRAVAAHALTSPDNSTSGWERNPAGAPRAGLPPPFPGRSAAPPGAPRAKRTAITGNESAHCEYVYTNPASLPSTAPPARGLPDRTGSSGPPGWRPGADWAGSSSRSHPPSAPGSSSSSSCPLPPQDRGNSHLLRPQSSFPSGPRDRWSPRE